jgi:LysM repeat protein
MADTQAGVLKFLIFVVSLIKKYAMRLRATVLLLISFFFVQFAQSQSNELIVQGQTGALYLEHTVVARETWYSIGRLYNLPPKELTAYNHLTLTQPLAIGQAVRVPLTATNFSQDGQKTPAEKLVPVMHVVQEKEWMYRISVNHNKVPIPILEKWNHITGAQLHPGLHLIVGYLKVKTALSALAAGGGAPAVAGAGTTGAGAAKAGQSDGGTTTAANSTGTPAQAATPQTGTPARADGGMAAPVTKKPADSTPVAPVASVAPVVSKPPAAKVVDNSGSSTAATTAGQFAPHFNGGVFKSDFSDGGKSATGQSGIFKSTSGWQDGKYYALMNNVAVGTIIRVSDASTGRSVYAKVLGQLPDMKESAGLTVRLSNAAAAELGEGDATRFNVGVNY